jgi:hypothetical protein
MKNTLLNLCTTFCLLFSVHGYSNPFIGTWQLVSGEYINGENKIVDYADADINSIKVLSVNHYSFISMSGDKFWAAGAGNYQFDAKMYSEIPIHTSYNITEGSQYTFQYQLINEFWHNSRWEKGKRVEYEIWRKLK